MSSSLQSLEDNLLWILQDFKDNNLARRSVFIITKGKVSKLQGFFKISRRQPPCQKECDHHQVWRYLAVGLQNIKEKVQIKISSKTCQEAIFPPNSSLKSEGGYTFLQTPFLNIYQPFLIPSPTLDLFKVTPSSPCSQSSAFLLHWLTAESL